MFKHNNSNNIYLSNLANNLKNSKALKELQLNFYKEFQLTAVVGAELEFYLNEPIEISTLEEMLPYKFSQEKGTNQYEVNFEPTNNLCDLGYQIEDFKSQLISATKILGVKVIFHPKPNNEDYGSALHIHVNFLNNKGKNYFDNLENLNFIASSLCFYLIETFLIFAPVEESFNRFNHNFMAPTNISFGNNNRTTAIRIPDSKPKRLEHRVAGSDCDPYLVLSAIFQAIYLGLQNPDKIILVEKIYGNAYDAQYNLPPLPKNLNETRQKFNKQFFDE